MFELSNEHFNDGVDDASQLKMIPCPYKSKQTVNGTDQEVTQVICIWRAYIVGTLSDVTAEKAKKPKTDYEMMLELMGGAKIANA